MKGYHKGNEFAIFLHPKTIFMCLILVFKMECCFSDGKLDKKIVSKKYSKNEIFSKQNDIKQFPQRCTKMCWIRETCSMKIWKIFTAKLYIFWTYLIEVVLRVVLTPTFTWTMGSLRTSVPGIIPCSWWAIKPIILGAHRWVSISWGRCISLFGHPFAGRSPFMGRSPFIGRSPFRHGWTFMRWSPFMLRSPFSSWLFFCCFS